MRGRHAPPFRAAARQMETLMRRSQFTENEIRHLLYEANTGVSVAEICTTSGISLRTFYRWRRRYGGLARPIRESAFF
ncbi:helix-turn-helix domain-containing protein [Bradyrhizobium sp. 2S1]|uniref:helix-turn-helix domain-containing protein n=1 Tax=Bradyrhizobium sp. 2S1 TaxID=1404429 RepID=UPI0039C89D2B